MRVHCLIVAGATVVTLASCADDGPQSRSPVESAGRPLEGISELHVAAQLDDADRVRALVSSGMDITEQSTNGMNALQHAASAGSVAVVEVLVEAGADVDEPSGAVTQGHGSPRDRGPTALAIAARAGHTESVRTLLDLGADPDVSSEAGITPLYSAIFGDAPAEIVTILLGRGVDTSRQVDCIEGCSDDPTDALGWARRLERDELVAVLE